MAGGEGTVVVFFFFQAEDGIRGGGPSRGLGDVYRRQGASSAPAAAAERRTGLPPLAPATASRNARPLATIFSGCRASGVTKT